MRDPVREVQIEGASAEASAASSEFAPTVLHVTEALGAGVGRSLARLVQLQTAAGARCVVVATRRYDTPDDDELRRWFGPGVELHLAGAAVSRRRQLVWLSLRTRSMLRSGMFDAVHLHSSFAGAVGRAVAASIRRRVPVFYSPHGFAFLRTDLSPRKRQLVRAAEHALSLLPGRLVLVSPSEREVAERVLRRVGDVLPNGVDLAECVPSVRAVRSRPKVVMVGRVTYQKAPWRFADAARRLGGEADFEWLGYGEDADVRRWLTDAPVRVSGALAHHELVERLAEADVIYFPTLWEGMPLALIEAQACGIPAVASSIDGNRDVVEEGVTGFLRDDEEGMFAALRAVLQDEDLRWRMASAARGTARRFSDERRGIESLRLYGRSAHGG